MFDDTTEVHHQKSFWSEVESECLVARQKGKERALNEAEVGLTFPSCALPLGYCTLTMRYSTLVLALAASLPTCFSFSETFPVVAWSSHR